MTVTIPLRPFRLLFLIRSLNYGGAERQLVALAKGLWSREQSLAIATFYPGGAFSKDLELVGVPVVSLEKRSRWGIFRFLWRLFRLVRTTQPQILHGYLGTANILTEDNQRPLIHFGSIPYTYESVWVA